MHQWTTFQPPLSTGFTSGSGLAFDSSGDFYLSGETNTTLANLTGGGSQQFFIEKYNVAGSR